MDKAVLAASPYYFRGYDTENITSNTFSYSGAHLDGTNIVMTDETLGEAVGFLSLNEPGHDISTSVDLGGLEIDFATTSVVAQEGTAGSENDVPTVKIDFCGSNYSNVISTQTIAKANNAVAGSVVLSSNVTIPSGTRSLIIYLDGQNTNQTSSNTVVFQNTSFIIHDQSAPSCGVNYNTSWTNGSVTLTVTAADSDSGLEGIYKDGTKVSSTSPYSFTVSSNASYLIYSKDYAQKTSATQNVTINNIDKTVPSAPASITLSHDSWTNTDVGITMPTLTQDSGSPIRYIYKIDSGSWQDLPNNFILSNSGQYNISVAVADAAGNVSSSVSDIIYIDKLAPVINNVSQTVSSGSCVISVNTSDAGLSGLKETKYASGSHDAAYFTSGGTSFTDGAFTVSTGGIYTIYISDNAGNFITSEYTLNTAPSIVDLLDVNMNEDEIYNVPLNITENETSLDKLSVTATSSDTTLIPNIIINQSSDEISLDIVPGANLFGGPVTITVEVSDEQGEKVTDTFSVTVLAVNDAPIALDDAGIVTNEDESIRIDVLANDSDLIDGDSLTIIDAGTPLHGTASVVNGKIKYIPSADYNGTDSFTYTISDGNGGTASATVYISATDVNDAPVAADDTAQTVEDSSVLIDVLINDNDIDMTTTDNEEISLISATNGSHGTTVIENGKIRYTPNADWFGKDVFTYTISDKAGLTDTAFVTVTVLGINDLPQFTGLNDEYTINEDSIAAPVNFSISDAETENRSLMLQAVSLNENIIENGKVKIEGLGDESASVSIKLTPVANAYGDVTIKLALGDGFTTVFKTIAVHVANVNDNPVAYADEIKYDEDTPYVLINTNNLISNDKDIDKDTLSFNGINTTTSVGTLEQVDSDTYKYIPQADYDGTDSFSYIVIDNNGGSAIGTCTLIANPINDAPSITIPQAEYITNEDTTISDINLNIYDKETNASGLIVRAGSNNTDLVSADKISVINNNDGTCTLTVEPMPDANGTAVINVTVSDGSLSSTKSVNLKINAVADAPVAVDDSIYVPISGKQSFNAMLNDRDADGDEINVVSFDASSLSGLLTYNDITKKFTYWASSGEHGESTFTYTISDGDETTSDSTATVTLDVHNINHAPQISAIANQHIAEDSRVDGISIKVSDEDYNDTISVNATSNNTTLMPQDYENNIIITDNHDGTYALSLVPAANMNGNVNITVTATDAAGSSDSTTFTLYVYPDNDAPLAVDDAVSTNEDNSVGLNLLSNDSDPEGDNIWINYIQTPSHGIISRSGNAYTYTPYGNYSGTEVLTYKTTDGQNASTATVTITVNPVNDAPIAWSDWRELPNEINQSSVISVLSNDYDPDGDTIHLYQIINQPSFGTAVVNANGTVTYTRTSISANANGADSFTYRIIDRETASGDYSYDDATVYIGVEFTSSLYTYDKYVSCMEDAAAFTITLPISNPNNVNLELTINDTTSLGTFEVIDATHVQFTPAANAYGNASITYTAEQVGGGESIGGEIILTVYPVNDEPIIDSAPASVSCDEDSAGSTFNVLFHDIDCTDGDLVFYAYAQNTSSSCPVVLTSDIQINRQTGTATVNAKPIENANGAVNIIVGVSDGISKTERTVAMTVNPVDDYPYVTSVNKTLYEDTNVTFGVILPNSDVDNDGLKVSIASGDAPAHGAAIVNDDGTITYTPNEDYYGDDSLVFSVSDDTSAGLTSKQTAYFTITPVNDQPVISNLNYYQSTKEDTPKDVNLTVTDVDNDLSASSCYTITSSNQDLIPNSNISISQVSGYDMKVYLVPKANAYGSTIISITASDGELSTKAEFKLTVESVNDVPAANDDTASVDENVGASVGTTSVTINVTGNDTDVEDATLKVSAISNISTGTVTNNNDGTLTYSVEGDYNGTATFDYAVMDSSGASDTASVTVTINAMNDPPKTADDYKTTQEDTQAVIAVLANDTDVEGDTLSLTDVYGCTHGTADIEGNNIVYTPNENYYGTDQFTYEVSDGNGGTSTAIVHMTITSVNDAPVIENILQTAAIGQWMKIQRRSLTLR
ncbi:MAG: tandem-95 repeat protein [Eubacteriaceae bacterium]